MNLPMEKSGNNIGTLRFIGAFMVLYGHSYALSAVNQMDPISPWFESYSPWHQPIQSLGVILFFVLSGYLVTQSYLNKQNILSYLTARCARIYPALIVAILFCVFVVGLSQTTLPISEYLHHKTTRNYFWHNITLRTPQFILPGVFENLPTKLSVNGSIWTLPIELRLYFIVGLLGVLRILNRAWLFNIVVVVSLIYFLVFPHMVWRHFSPSTPYLVLSFAIGAFVSANGARKWLNVRTIALLLILSILAFIKNDLGLYNYIALLTLGVVVLYAGMCMPLTLPKLDKHGDFSYGLYLYAFPLQQLTVTYVGEGKPLVVMAVSLCGALLLAIFSWFVIEQPTMGFVRNHLINDTEHPTKKL